jgi:hypothetical protein
MARNKNVHMEQNKKQKNVINSSQESIQQHPKALHLEQEASEKKKIVVNNKGDSKISQKTLLKEKSETSLPLNKESSDEKIGGDSVLKDSTQKTSVKKKKKSFFFSLFRKKDISDKEEENTKKSSSKRKEIPENREETRGLQKKLLKETYKIIPENSSAPSSQNEKENGKKKIISDSFHIPLSKEKKESQDKREKNSSYLLSATKQSSTSKKLNQEQTIKNPFSVVMSPDEENGSKTKKGRSPLKTNKEDQNKNITPENNMNDLASSIVQGIKVNKEKKPSPVLGDDFSEEVDSKKTQKEKKEKKKKKNRKHFLLFSRFLVIIALVFHASSFIVFKTILDPESSLSDAIEAKNFGKDLKKLEEEKEEKVSNIKILEEDISSIETKIENIRDNKILSHITSNRVDFLEVMIRIHKIILDSLDITPETNQAVKRIVFDTYSGKTDEKGNTIITISGVIRDPKKMSISRLTQLMETINSDKHFHGASIRSFSKVDDDEGGSKSSFTFNFSYIQDPEIEGIALDNDK